MTESVAPAHCRGVLQHPARPPVDVEFSHVASHQPHALAPLVGAHRQRRMQRAGAFVGVIGIDDQRLGEFPRRTGEAGQDQHTAVVVTGRNELLRDQVHAVVEAADEAQVRGAQVFVDGIRFVVLLDQDDGRRLRRGVFGVDAFRQRSHALGIAPVVVDRPARRRRDLREREPPDPARMQLEQALDGADALFEPLGIVQPIDAHASRGGHSIEIG